MTWRRRAGEPCAPAALAASAAFEADVLPLAPSLYRMAYHLTRNRAEAEDLTQETFLRAFRGYRDFRGGNLKAWVFTILRNAYRDECRRRGREPILEADLNEGVLLINQNLRNLEPSAEVEALRRLPNDAIERAFAVLPPEWRLVVILADVEELTYREIAEVTEIPIGTVMSRLSRARKRLQSHLLATSTSPRPAREKSA
ncbi:MAG: sigma-70 family RNA polymerase sigma factor [Thermomicrobiales bacterium]